MSMFAPSAPTRYSIKPGTLARFPDIRQLSAGRCSMRRQKPAGGDGAGKAGGLGRSGKGHRGGKDRASGELPGCRPSVHATGYREMMLRKKTELPRYREPDARPAAGY